MGNVVRLMLEVHGGSQTCRQVQSTTSGSARPRLLKSEPLFHHRERLVLVKTYLIIVTIYYCEEGTASESVGSQALYI